MLTIGVDAHTRVSMAVAIDVAGRAVARWRGPTTAGGWRALEVWSTTLDTVRQWGSAGAWHDGRGLAQSLVAAGAVVDAVTARLTAAGCRRARRPDKHDRLDARAVARAGPREEALPPVTGADDPPSVAALVAERAALVVAAPRRRNQLHQLLAQLDPDDRSQLPARTSQRGVHAAASDTTDDAQPVAQHRARTGRRLAQRLQLVLEQVRGLTPASECLAVRHWTPLTAVFGVSLVTAAALAGLLGPGRRFQSDAHLAASAGVAPVDAASAAQVRPRLTRGGTRRLTAMLHRLAVPHARGAPAAQADSARRLPAGKPTRDAVRARKRHLARVIWRRWAACLAAIQRTAEAIAAERCWPSAAPVRAVAHQRCRSRAGSDRWARAVSGGRAGAMVNLGRRRTARTG
jgi:hypothetical protein